MFGISFEHLLIVGVILLLVGPRRLPELGHTMGKAIKNFKDSFSGVEEASYKKIEPNAAASFIPPNTPTGQTLGNNPSAAEPAMNQAAQNASTQTNPQTHA